MISRDLADLVGADGEIWRDVTLALSICIEMSRCADENDPAGLLVALRQARARVRTAAATIDSAQARLSREMGSLSPA